jgi:hypothetical protein
MNLREGQTVVLVTPENRRLNGATATIVELTPWGAHVTTPAAATGKYRALASEMVLPIKYDQPHPEMATQYTGDVCTRCGGTRMRHVGTCSVCEDCGESGGCG